MKVIIEFTRQQLKTILQAILVAPMFLRQRNFSLGELKDDFEKIDYLSYHFAEKIMPPNEEADSET